MTRKRAKLALVDRASTRPRPRRKAVSIPVAPEYLGPRARVLWGTIAAPLYKAGLLSELTVPACAELVSAWSQVLELRADVEKYGTVQVVRTESGSDMERARPAATLLADAEKRFRMMLKQFGLTPASLGQVKVADRDANDGDPVAAFL